MSSPSLSVKWGKETHAVPLSASCALGAAVKAALAAATGVPAARQKVMSKAWKGVLADDTDVLAGCLALAASAPVPATLMGSAEAGVARPAGAAGAVRARAGRAGAGGAARRGVARLECASTTRSSPHTPPRCLSRICRPARFCVLARCYPPVR